MVVVCTINELDSDSDPKSLVLICKTNIFFFTDYPDIKADEKRMEHLECLTSVLKELLDDELMPNQSELMGIYGRLVVNGFNILDPEMNSVATGLYLGVSITDHSCVPNAIATFEGTKLFIRTLKDLPCLDWSKVINPMFY